jgi:pyruvate formate lyase activating enzyme
MKILGFQAESFIDWQAGLSSVVYTGNCNFKCYGCHAGGLIKKTEEIIPEKVLKKLAARRRYIDKIVICGGEPTLESDLTEFLEKLKSFGMQIKLDTNGSNPDKLREIMDRNLVDYVAMDVKSSRELYSRVIGIETSNAFFDRIEQSMKLLCSLGAGKYEFRTTLFPIVSRDGNKEEFRWMTSEEIKNMCGWIAKATGKKEHSHYLQKFQTRDEEIIIDKSFSKSNLPEQYHETPSETLEQIRADCKKAGYELKIR